MTEQNIHLLWDEEIDALVLESVIAVLDNMEAYQEHQGGRAELSETIELFRTHLLTNGLDSIVNNDVRHTEVEAQEELPLFVEDEAENDGYDSLEVELPDSEPGALDPFSYVEFDEEEDSEAERLAEEIRVAEEEAWQENAERDAEALRIAEEEAWRENAERDAEALRIAEEEAVRLAEEIRIAEEEAWIEYEEREEERLRLAEEAALAAYEAEAAERANRPSPRSILAHAKSLESE